MESLPPTDLAQPHVAVAFVIDVSGSMNSYMGELSKAFNKFVTECQNDARLNGILDFALITFDHEIKEEYGFKGIRKVEPFSFTNRNGATAITEPLKRANEMVRARTTEYKNAGVDPYKPWIVLMSDGAPYPEQPDKTNLKAFGEVLKKRQADGKVQVISVGVGPDYDVEVLSAITDRMLKFENYEFMKFLDWVGQSLAKVSDTAPGADVQYAPLQNDYVIPFGNQKA